MSEIESNEDGQSNSKNSISDKYKRRTILKSSSVGALGLFGLPNTPNFKTSDRNTRIVAARKGVKAEPAHTKKVPKKWLQHQETMRTVTGQLQKQFWNKPFVGSISYTATDRMKDGVYYSEPEIAVSPSATDYQLSQLPDSLDRVGINQSNSIISSNIRTRRMNGEPVTANVDCYRNITSRPFPGGLEINDASTSKWGTGGCRATDGNNDYLYTANHVVADACHVGTGWIQDADGDSLGHGAEGHKTHDWVMINDESTSYSDNIWYEDGIDRVDGYATQDGMDSIQGQKGTLKFQGIISGYQDAHVKGGGASFSGPNLCVKYFGSATKIGMPDYGREGDSGGPFWWPTSDGNHVVSVLSGMETGGDYDGCGVSGKKGRPCYCYPFWRISNNTRFTIE